MQSLGFKIETSHSCQQRQHKTCRRILSDCYFPVRRRGQDKREGIALWSLSGLLMHSCLLQGFFCLHCAWLGRRLLCYPLPLEATLQALLGVRCEGGQRLVCSSCTDQEGAGEGRGPKRIWGWGKNPFPARSAGWGWSNFHLNIAPVHAVELSSTGTMKHKPRESQMAGSCWKAAWGSREDGQKLGRITHFLDALGEGILSFCATLSSYL